jgi:hypothetical protein
MSTTVAIVAAASAGNSAAIAAAERAHDRSCQALIQGFDAKGATTQAQIAYADCVQRLNPQDITGDGKVGLAIIMVLMITGFVIGAINSEDFMGDGLISRLLGGFIGLSIAFVAGMLIVGLLHGLMLLFS